MPFPDRTQELLSLLNESKLLILKEIMGCNDPLCGCDLVDRLEIPKNLLSYHIRTLREAGYLEETRCGKNKQYRIAEGKRPKIEQILSTLELI